MRHLKNKIRPKPLSILTYMKNNNKSYPQKIFFGVWGIRECRYLVPRQEKKG